MKRIVAFFIRYPVWANVLMFSVMGFGVISFFQMNFSFFPETKTGIVTVQVAYPGASPVEVEEGVVLKIEENLDGIEGVDRITSISRENFSQVMVEFREGYDFAKALQDVKNAVDRINSFPRGAEKPVIFEQPSWSRALSVVLHGEADLVNLKYIAESLRDRLLAEPEISLVSISGVPNPEISIEVSEADLRKYRLTFDEIAGAVSAANINLSGGKFDTREEEILIRANAREYRAKDLQNLVVRGNPDGTLVYLKDVARVRERWEDIPDKIFYNGRQAVVLSVDKTEDEDILAIAAKTKEILADFNARNEKVQTVLLDDRTIHLKQRLNLLKNNGLIGLSMVIFALGFFLNLRLSFWVSIGIPFSFAGMFIVANLSGITINAISSFGMIIVVGILVDDAIVVGENIYAHYERGKSAFQAAVDGASEMLGPVFTSVSTTIIAFLPFFFLEGFLGKFIWHMALVVIASLSFSLIEAFLVLPAHLAHSKGLHPHKDDPPARKKIERFIKRFTYGFYQPLLQKSLKHKWVTVTLPLVAILVTVGLLKGGFIGLTPFPFIDGDSLPINVSLVSGRQEYDTERVLARIEQAAWRVNERIRDQRADGLDVIRGIRREIGRNDFGETGSHTGRLRLELLDGETRNMDSWEIAAMLRNEVGVIPEAQNITFGRQGFFGKPVSISLLGNDLSQLNKARDLLVGALSNLSTLKDITDSNQEGRRELNIRLKPKAYSLGLTLNDVARQVRQGFFGQEVQRIQRGRDEVKVWVRYQPEDRAAMGFLDQMRIRTPDGAEYPFSELADYEVKRGIIAISHLDKKREVRVEANLANEKDDLPPILEHIRTQVIPGVLAQVQGIQVSYEGQSRGRAKEAASMKRAFPLAFLAILILLVLVFRSYLQALLIYSMIPLGVVGAAWGHGIQGVQMSFLSLYGIIALSGIIVNDSIVLVDQINRNLRAGQKVVDAVIDAAVSRLRPILLTSITTAVGLAPLIMETSRQAQFLIPMAISVAYGLIFGTFILLFIVPCGFLILNKMRYGLARLSGRTELSYESVEPAVKELQTPEFN